MRVVANYDLCESNGLCEAFAPDVFELDDDDNLQILGEHATDDHRAQIEQAVASCPKAALSIEE